MTHFFKTLCAGAMTLSCALLTSSCSNDSTSNADEQDASTPIIVTEAEFQSARYQFAFFTQSGQVIRLTPTAAAALGTAVPAQMSIDGTSVSTPVLLEYELVGDFLDSEQSDDYEAIGEITLTFRETTGSSIDFFAALGVTINPVDEETAAALPLNSSIDFTVAYVDPGGTSLTVTANTEGTLADVLATWNLVGSLTPYTGELQFFIESQMLQGSYNITRN